MRNVTVTRGTLTGNIGLFAELGKQAKNEEWWKQDLNITISQQPDTEEWVAKVVLTPKERIVVYLSIDFNDRNGKHCEGYKSHIITLANKEALEKFSEAVSDGVIPWNDVLEQGDVLEYDDNLDS